MKKIIFTYLMVSIFAFCAVSAQTGSAKNSPVGKWKFEAPSAPEGYNSGSISISFAENKYSTAVSLTGSDYAIPGDKTKVENDSVTFTVLLEGTEIAISLKAENRIKMTGKAVYVDGEIPLTLTKDVPKK
jgi:carbonic anhydrase